MNLRHLRAFLALTETGSVTATAAACFVSQPAVTQAIRKLEQEVGTDLFQRTPQGLFPTASGKALAMRVARTFALMDPALREVSPRLCLTATTAQLTALIAMREAENFTLAARRLGLAQPTVHRAITQLEREAGHPLFERTPYGRVATRPAQALALAARLAFAELDQARSDLAELAGREAGRIVIGAMPLSRSHLLPMTITRFRRLRPSTPILVLDGPYEDMLAATRRGEMDFMIGALRNPAPIGDVEQVTLFDDELVLVSSRTHPLAEKPATLAALAEYPWIVARTGTPARAHFDKLFAPPGPVPASIVESGSLILMRELLAQGDHLGCVSRAQAEVEARHGLMTILPFRIPNASRPIGLTLRRGWLPTKAQAEFLADLHAICADPARMHDPG